MTTQASEPPTTALAVSHQGITYNLDAFPEDRFNRLIPTQTIRMASDLMVPVIQIVQLDLERDTYTSKDVPEGKRALNRIGLRKLATAAGISVIDERKTDDGSDPDVCEVTCLGEMVIPTGQRIRATGMKRIDLRAQHWASDAQRKKFASFFQEHVASRAEHRMIRALLSLEASYPIPELRRPFAVVSYAPNMNHPEVRARILEAMAPTVAQLYGPATAAPQIAGPVITAPEAPEDDDAIEGESHPVDEPAWFGEPQAETMPQTLLRVLREKAASFPGPAGPATAEQRARLQPVMKPLGLDATAAGLRLVFGLEDLRSITTGQADAILACSVDDSFVDLWRELVAGEGKAAA